MSIQTVKYSGFEVRKNTSSRPKPTPTTQVHSLISTSNFPIYLASDTSSNKKYAMKVFEFQNNTIHPAYLAETKMIQFKHPHVMSIDYKVDEETTLKSNIMTKQSYYLMELCYTDFAKLITKFGVFNDEKLTRTYFLQLIDGLTYLHENDLSHLDIKLGNLLLSEKFELKICDFDKCIKGTAREYSLGTKNFRAPEIMLECCYEPKKADIYSLGVVLFAMMFGYLPYQEHDSDKNDLFRLVQEEPEQFWEAHSRINSNVENLDTYFKDLFMMLVYGNPLERPDVDQIKSHVWCKGPVYTQSELEQIMKKRMNLI